MVDIKGAASPNIDGRMIVDAGTSSWTTDTNGDATKAVTFSESFPAAPTAVIVTPILASGNGGDVSIVTASVSENGFTAQIKGGPASTTVSFYWVAIYTAAED